MVKNNRDRRKKAWRRNVDKRSGGMACGSKLSPYSGHEPFRADAYGASENVKAAREMERRGTDYLYEKMVRRIQPALIIRKRLEKALAEIKSFVK
jgi:hypothetical protein